MGDLMGHEAIINTSSVASQISLPWEIASPTTLWSAWNRQNKYHTCCRKLNTSDDRGIGVVREQVLTFASTKTLFSGKFKLIILDEADAMTKDAQNALRRIIEKFSENARFCLICNYLSKITQAIQSRCTRFRFPPLQKSDMITRLSEIAKNESVQLTEDGKAALYRFSSGDMRAAINLLQSASLSGQVVDEATVYACAGYPAPREMRSLLDWCLNEPFPSALKSAFFHCSLTQVNFCALTLDLKMPDNVKVGLITMLSDVEYRMSCGASEKLQLGAVCAALASAKDFLGALEA
ncbi:unnamed protein product [Hydatigera taeniaeformis]|uniref:Replication factor C C-terminal domain-containing protein n=1 Tax=Hydatigena taeniaeformis TaxID=6205 RepID=A0A3P7E4K7_HYDTA|nr:unnamed protein product [Hydatigera taeniaeformis]